MKTELFVNENGAVEVHQGKSASAIRLESVQWENLLARTVANNITEVILEMAEHHNISPDQLMERIKKGEKFKKS